MRNHPTDRDAPKPIEPPTGALEVYTYDPKTGRAALHLACGDDAGRAVTAMRKAEGIACYARGGVVCGVKYGTPPSLVAPMKAAVKAAHADRSNDRTHALAPDGAVVEADDTERLTDVEPKAPSTHADHDEETMTEAADACERCEKHPVAGVTKTTPKGTETWCTHCRRVESAKRNSSAIGGDRRSKAPQSAKPAKKQPRRPAPKSVPPAVPQSDDPMAPLREALDALVSGGVSEARVREIVREELRPALRSLAVGDEATPQPTGVHLVALDASRIVLAVEAIGGDR